MFADIPLFRMKKNNQNQITEQFIKIYIDELAVHHQAEISDNVQH